MSRCHRLPGLMLVVALVVQSTSLRANAEDVSPLSLVDESAALCLEVPRFEETWSSLQQSELVSRLKSFPPVERFLSGPGFQKWLAVEQYVRATTGKTLSDQLIGAFSESILVAVYLPESNQKPQGILFGQARNEDALKQALQTWSALDPNHVAQGREHKGHQYVRRAKSANSSEVVYHAAFDRIFVLSDHESLVQGAIDLYIAASRNRATSVVASASPQVLKESALYRTSRARLSKDGAAFLYLNVRAWDKVLEEATRHSADAAQVRNAFQYVAAIAMSLRLDNEIVVDVVADISRDSRSSTWRQFVGGTNRAGDWASRVPPAAFLAVSSRMDVLALVQAWLAIIPESKTREFARGRTALNSVFLGQDIFLRIVPGLLRDWTVSVSTAEQSTSPEVPVDVHGRFSVAAGASPDRTFGRSLDNALHFGMNLTAAYFSFQSGEPATPVVTSAESTENGLVRSLVGLPTWTPSYLLGPDSLTVSTNRAALLRAPSVSQPKNSRLVFAERRYFEATTQLVWLDAVQLRELLAKNGKWISAQIAPDSSAARERLQTHLSSVGTALKLFDVAFVAAGFEDDHVRVVFGAALDRNP